MSLIDASNLLASKEGDGVATYRGVTFYRAEAESSQYSARRAGRTGITVTGAMLYIRSVLKMLGMVPDRDWGGVKRGEMTMDQVAEVLTSEGGPDVAAYRGLEISKASINAFAEQLGKDISIKIAKEYIRSAIKRAK